ncbi:hypothetical protein SAMN05421840_11645 [Shewanella morhuae]|nr:hypothetical protein SAMN05421840_11645 [Shewanella morhuae]
MQARCLKVLIDGNAFDSLDIFKASVGNATNS